jgi:hypothetical protein
MGARTSGGACGLIQCNRKNLTKAWHVTNLLLGWDNHGGYGVVRKVWIKIFDYTPNMIELMGKTPKTNDKRKTH